MIAVSISFPNRQRRTILLSSVPDVGHHLRLGNGPDAKTYAVEYVLHMEGNQVEPAPNVVIVVRSTEEGPPV